MNTPNELVYSKEHEWILVDQDEGTIGITDYAQKELGDVVYVELPEKGDRFSQGESFGSLESVKAVSEVYMPVGGEIAEVNEALEDSPEDINNDPYVKGWLIKIRIDDETEVDDLMSSDEYVKFLAEESPD